MKRLCVVAIAGLAALAGLAPAAAAARTTAVNMVALGDSYASGTGAGDYFPGTEGACWRSRNALPEVVAGALRERGAQVKLTNVTCSGAATADLSTTFKGQSPQLDALRPDTTLVTLGIGTNDVGFAQYGGLCVQSDCSGAPTDALMERLPAMRAQVEKLLADVKARSPRAKIVLTGYGAQLSPAANAPDIQHDPVCGDGIFTPKERVDGNRAARAIDLNLRYAALIGQLSGIKVKFVSPYTNSRDLTPEFAGHSLCEAKTSFYRGFDALAPGQEGQEAVFHLNKSGQAALAGLALRKV
jgi:lysophospholipase L1-like esterase